MYNAHILHIILGFHGESLPFDSGHTSVIKGHGHYSPLGFDTRWSEQSVLNDTFDQINKTQGVAVLLMRNPYRAIYGFRHYTSGGRVQYTDVSKFFGDGKYAVSSTISLYIMLDIV